MGKLLWQPSEDRIQQANMIRFITFVNQKHALDLGSYDRLYDWSVANIPAFWASFWEFAQVISSRPYEEVVDDLSRFPGASWFKGARLNFAENLLRYRDDHAALVFADETRQSRRLSYRELYDRVARTSHYLLDTGVKRGDRVAAYMPNLIETVIAMLAATSIGAVWSSCATDLGVQAAADRLGQIEPKVLFTVDGYLYKGKPYNSLPNAAEIARRIPSLMKVIVVPYLEKNPDCSFILNSVDYSEVITHNRAPEIPFVQLPFDHPGFIMFSSGTTGKPKCFVQSAAGVLLNHLKELLLHTDLKREDTITYITTCSWMMWNWLLSALAVGATLVLYEGSPVYPDEGAMWRLIQNEGITIFGCSASYINFLQNKGFMPGRTYDLSRLREISQTGSVLSPEGFEYIYQAIKKDLHFNSISGGTDINGCFAMGSPIDPVYAGELQKRALAMKTNCYGEQGHPVYDQMGELVCEAPSPSMPLYFWNDPEKRKYIETYFSMYPNVWRHGDFIKIHSDTRGVTFFGRSDAVLKPSGVRIGTAEIYNIVENMEEISDSLAIGQQWRGDQRIILFVKLTEGHRLTDDLRARIKRDLREKASPRHVPSVILEAPDIPYTHNMKKVETVVSHILHRRPVSNRDALMNPGSLGFFERITKELEDE